MTSLAFFNLEASGLWYMVKMEQEGQLALPKSFHLLVHVATIEAHHSLCFLSQFEHLRTSNHGCLSPICLWFHEGRKGGPLAHDAQRLLTPTSLHWS